MIFKSYFEPVLENPAWKKYSPPWRVTIDVINYQAEHCRTKVTKFTKDEKKIVFGESFRIKEI